MNDRESEIFDQYKIEVLKTRKGRGAILCDLENESLILKPYFGSEERAACQNCLLMRIADRWNVTVERIIPTEEGKLLARDSDGMPYILKTWVEGRECNIYDREERLNAVRMLAQLHNAMCAEESSFSFVDTASVQMHGQFDEFEKHNKEMKRIQKYLQQKKQKQSFEMNLLNTGYAFVEKAVQVTQEWKKYALPETEKCTGCYCHGDYQYHNILLGKNGWFISNFEKFARDNPIRDLYLFMRKILEKSNWSVDVGREILEAYQEERRISEGGFIDLYYRLAYPEKFWKIANFYYNSRKSWIPEKNQEKLDKLLAQEQQKQYFLDRVFQHQVH